MTYYLSYAFQITKAFFFTNKFLSAIENNIHTGDIIGTNIQNSIFFFLVLRRDIFIKRTADGVTNLLYCGESELSPIRVSYT